MTIPLHESADYARGYLCGEKDATQRDRIEAFAAIRRAAEVAREIERECRGTGCHHEDQAWQVRRAIRAAIGSAKA